VTTLHLSWPRERIFALTAAIILSISFAAVVAISGGDSRIIAVLLLVSASALAISNFGIALSIVIIALFVDYYVTGLSSAVWCTVVLAASFLFRYTDLRKADFANPLSKPILIYGLCILPSFLFNIHPFISLLKLLNVGAFLIVMYSFVAGIRSRRMLMFVLGVYLIMVLLNSIHVIAQFFGGVDRPFGFAGIMFVDYSALAVCVTAALSFTSRGTQRLLFTGLATVYAIALIMTGTRNTWVSSAITLALLAGYVTMRPEAAGLTRKSALSLILAGLILVGGSATYIVLNTQRIEKRALQVSGEKDISIDQRGKAENSLVSRILIWDTAWNAFLAHPLVGIGVYSFPYSSDQYYHMPKILYILYVEGVSPHQTQLAVLAETGVIGAIGYMMFMFALLKTGYEVLGKSSDPQQMRLALVAFTAIVYSTISMIFTDAWLWGQGIVLFGLVVGGMLAIRNLERQELAPGAV